MQLCRAYGTMSAVSVCLSVCPSQGRNTLKLMMKGSSVFTTGLPRYSSFLRPNFVW